MTSSTGLHTLTPDDLATIYDIAPLYQSGIDGTGQKIAVMGGSAFPIYDGIELAQHGVIVPPGGSAPPWSSLQRRGASDR